MPTQLLVGPNAPSGKKTIVEPASLIAASSRRDAASAMAQMAHREPRRRLIWS